jgi:hypothetical protein
VRRGATPGLVTGRGAVEVAAVEKAWSALIKVPSIELVETSRWS